MTRSSDACERLARTRESLRVALQEIRHPAAPPQSAYSTGWVGSLLRRLREIPGAQAIALGVGNWAARSPLPVAAYTLAQALDALVRPVAQRSPGRLVLGAVALGGLLGWGRRWPRVFTPALAAAVLPQLLSGAVGGVPAQSWLTLIASVLETRARAAAAR